MKAFIFIPDTDTKAGYGHLYRCYGYSNFIEKQNKLIFLIKDKFNRNNLLKKNLSKKKIQYIYYNDLLKTLKLLKIKYPNIVTILDTYHLNIRKLDFSKISNKHLNILDFKTYSKADFVIDHTFNRKKNFHKINNSILNIGINYFPIFKKINKRKKNIILINFGSINNKIIFEKSLNFLLNLNLTKKYKIIIINEFLDDKFINNYNNNHNILFYKFYNNIEKLYQKTYFSIGGCGISLYEKCFFHIPTISKCVARNQRYNYENFKKRKCLIDFKILNKPLGKEKTYYFLNKIDRIKSNLKKNFSISKNQKYIKKIFKQL